MPVMLLDPAGYRRMPWKNGGGTTTELALADLPGEPGRFLWRVSIADVAQAGPFSAFAGYERLIAVVEGAGMVLTVDGTPVTVRLGAPAFRFSGDAAVECRLTGGPIRDFNLIHDRERAEGRLELPADGAAAGIAADAVALVHALEGAALVRTAGETVRVPPGWTARVEGTAAEAGPEAGGRAVVAVVRGR
ncbi:HutD/Ves family protein [Azospirillum thermophilum]|nr:HutD family protein [Azospirillum thermophilum]